MEGERDQAATPAPPPQPGTPRRLPRFSPRHGFASRRERFLQDGRWFAGARDQRRFRISLERGLLLFATAVFSTGLLATFATTVSLFRIAAPVLLFAWAVVIVAVVVAAATKRIQFEGDRMDLAAIGVALVLAASAGVFHHHYFAAQSDIGFYATDAVASATTGSRVLQGPYDELIPGFNPGASGSRVSGMFGYSSLAALFVYALGPFASPWVNAPLAFITGLALYRVARSFASRFGAILGVTLYASSLLTVWMSRWLMTENGAAATFWTAAVLMITLVRTWDPLRAVVLAIALLYGALVRIEGFLVIAWFLLVLLIYHRGTLVAWSRTRFDLRRMVRDRPVTSGIGSLVVGATLVLVVLIARALPTDYIRGSVTIALQVLRGRPAADALDVPTTGVGPNWGDYALRYEWDSASAYFLPWFLLIAVIGLALGVVRRRPALFLLLLCLPYFAFIMIPPVTTAHPWFMRRLWVAIIPWIFLVAGGASDPLRAAWRWPRTFRNREQPNLTTGAVAAVVLLIAMTMNVTVSAPVALKREQDGVEPVIPQILARLPPGSTVILDDDTSQYAGMLRFEHDGDVVPWFNRRVASFFASLDATENGNGTVLLRVPATGRAFLTSDSLGFGPAVILNASIENPPRRDFRTYIASPPLEQGYDPFAAYLRDDVPPNEWRTASFQFQVIALKEPVFLSKNTQLEADAWGRSADGIVAVKPSSAIVFDTSHFRAEVIETFHLGLHLVYVQNGGPKEIRADDGTLLGVLPSDGSGRLANASLPLPTPLTISEVMVPQGTVLRGMLLDLAS